MPPPSGFVRVLVDLGRAILFVLVESLLSVALVPPSAVLRSLRTSGRFVREVTSTTSEAGIMRHRVASSHRSIHTYHTSRRSATAKRALPSLGCGVRSQAHRHGGCGDLINDYEGISGHDEYRPDLVGGVSARDLAGR